MLETERDHSTGFDGVVDRQHLHHVEIFFDQLETCARCPACRSSSVACPRKHSNLSSPAGPGCGGCVQHPGHQGCTAGRTDTAVVVQIVPFLRAMDEESVPVAGSQVNLFDGPYSRYSAAKILVGLCDQTVRPWYVFGTTDDDDDDLDFPSEGGSTPLPFVPLFIF